MEFSLTDPQIWASLLTLTVLEIVLGIDNIVFISVVVSRLPEAQRNFVRRVGIGLALIFRILLLLGIFWIIGLTKPVISLFGQDFSWRDIILLAGGLFLLAKATHEIHQNIENGGNGNVTSAGDVWRVKVSSVILQIIAIDLVFSVDSIVTAIGIAEHVEVMITAVIISMVVMYLASGAVSRFIERHPTTKMLALSFLLLIGAALVADALHFHIPRGYIYFAMLFAGTVEAFNIVAGKKSGRRTKLG